MAPWALVQRIESPTLSVPKVEFLVLVSKVLVRCQREGGSSQKAGLCFKVGPEDGASETLSVLVQEPLFYGEWACGGEGGAICTPVR